MPASTGGGEPKGTGRPMNDSVQNTIWAQRILKEEAVTSRNGSAGFCMRAAIGSTDVPAKFKVGHIDPQEAMRAHDFDPASVGWDPQGAEAREFRRNRDSQTEGPRTRHFFPETANHELGWLLAPRGQMVPERVTRRKLRMGLGWPEGPPATFSEVSTANPCAIPCGGSQLSACVPTELSCAAPASELSRASAAEPQRRRCSPSAARGAASELSRAGASQVSASSPVKAARYTRSRSSPAFSKAALVKHVGRQEDEVQLALDKSLGYLNKGGVGQRWTKFLNGTDVTAFENEFAKQNGGVPLYKMASR